ncbi:MAG: hypothetical protein ABSD62_02020 [Candidatus Limnocylindrales bacterium]|jgi:hypothetical protein
MDPNTAYMLSKARISELHAEGASNRLAAEARRKNRVESACRAEAAGRHARDLPKIDCSWIDRLLAFVRRAMPMHAA